MLLPNHYLDNSNIQFSDSPCVKFVQDPADVFNCIQDLVLSVMIDNLITVFGYAA